MVQLNNGMGVQEAAADVLNYIIQDMLDFAQIKADRFRKNIQIFNLEDVVNKVMMIQSRKAKDNSIDLKA